MAFQITPLHDRVLVRMAEIGSTAAPQVRDAVTGTIAGVKLVLK